MENKTENISIPDSFRKPASIGSGLGLALCAGYTYIALDFILRNDAILGFKMLAVVPVLAWSTLVFADTARLVGASADDPFLFRPTTIELSTRVVNLAARHFSFA
jgi:hypothetical protein